MDVTTIPAEPICRAPDDEAQPCPFWKHCHETRQRIQSGQSRNESGRWMTTGEPLRGNACWAYVKFRSRGVTGSTDPVPASTREPGEEPF